MPTIATDLLEIEYRDDPAHGGAGHAPVALLLHGWPDDASAWDDVVPRLNATGLRTIVPSLRGYAGTRFRDPDAPRTGNSGVLALDAIALMDALGIEAFCVAGHDWGANAAEALAVGWPDRVKRLAMLATPPRLGGMPTPPFEQAQRQWYHWFMATARGAQAVADDPPGFAHLHWVNWGPSGWFDEATFARTARSWDNPDFVAVTIHSYRARWGEAPPDPASRRLEDEVRATKTLSLPALYFQGEADGVNPPSATRDVPGKFTGRFEFVSLPGVGHFIPREAPDVVAAKLIALFTADDPGVVAQTAGTIEGAGRRVAG